MVRARPALVSRMKSRISIDKSMSAARSVGGRDLFVTDLRGDRDHRWEQPMGPSIKKTDADVSSMESVDAAGLRT